MGTVIKQLMPWKNTNLLNHVIAQLKSCNVEKHFVVTGAHQKAVSEAIKTNTVDVVHNDQWIQGMGSSISKILEYFDEHDLKFDGLLITTCDQPLVQNMHYNSLVANFLNSDQIIASAYKNDFGIPVLFGSKYFNQLKELSGEKGAKSLLKKHLNNLALINAPEAAVDLDTIEKYQAYYNKYGIIVYLDRFFSHFYISQNMIYFQTRLTYMKITTLDCNSIIGILDYSFNDIDCDFYIPKLVIERKIFLQRNLITNFYQQKLNQ